MKVRELIEILESVKNKEQDVCFEVPDAWAEVIRYNKVRKVRKQGDKIVIY